MTNVNVPLVYGHGPELGDQAIAAFVPPARVHYSNGSFSPVIAVPPPAALPLFASGVAALQS